MFIETLTQFFRHFDGVIDLNLRPKNCITELVATCEVIKPIICNTTKVLHLHYYLLGRHKFFDILNTFVIDMETHSVTRLGLKYFTLPGIFY